MIPNYYDDAKEKLKKSIHKYEIDQRKQKDFENILKGAFEGGRNDFYVDSDLHEAAFQFVKENKDELIRQGFKVEFEKGNLSNPAQYYFDKYRISIDWDEQDGKSN